MERRVAWGLDGVSDVEVAVGVAVEAGEEDEGMVVGEEDEPVDVEKVGGRGVPWSRRSCTSSVARTWCVRSRGIRVVFAARTLFEKIADADSGSHCHVGYLVFSFCRTVETACDMLT